MVQALPVEILYGIYLGILTGILPALASWGLGFLFRYFAGVSIPAFAVVVLALALAGINGGLLALADPTLLQSGYRIVVALIVVAMLSMYAHAMGDRMGATVPRRITVSALRSRTLSRDVIDFVGGRGEVTVEVVGPVADMEGYPSLPPDVRTTIETGEWRLPADLPIAELERRFADRLRTELDLADVAVSIDERGRATVAAAPPLSGISKRVPAGKRAVSVGALLPTGLARGDEVRLLTEDLVVEGLVVAARSDGGATTVATDGGSPTAIEPTPAPVAPTTAGGEGRVTVAVDRAEAERLLAVDRARVVVTARGTHREYELISLLRRAGKSVRQVTIGPDSELAGRTLADLDVRDVHDVAILAVRRPDGWTVAPGGATTLAAGNELFVVGRRTALEAFQEVLE